MVPWLRSSIIAFVLLGASSAFSQAPPPPAGLSVHAGLYGGAELHWDSTTGAVAYRIYKAIDDSPFGRVAEVFHREFADWYVYPGHSYHYFVTAGNRDGESGPSDTVGFRFDENKDHPSGGLIRGHITDDVTGFPLRDAVVRFFSDAGMWTERTHTDSGGAYWASLDTGKYLVRAERFGYMGEWFDNAQRIDSATVIHLHQDTVNADFALHALPIPLVVTVSGTVTDSVSGHGLGNAYVALVRPPRFLRELENITGLFGGFPAERLDFPELGELHGVVWAGRTDSSGSFTAHALAHLPVIAIAFKPGYIPKFFENKYSPLDADRLDLSGDTSGIDFALIPNPLAVNSLSGTVADSNGNGVPSAVILFRRSPVGRIPVRFRMTDSLGNFTFFHLAGGNVYLKAVPISNYAPAWYSATGCGVSSWRNADSVHIAGDVSSINICVVPAPSSGFARIAGNVYTNPPPPLGKASGLPPAQGVTVYAVSATNQIAGSDVTEPDGSFNLENIPPGTYSIVTDKEGFSATNSPSYTVDGSNNYEVSNSSVTLTPDAPTGVAARGSSLPTAFSLGQNYPNPFNPSTEVRFDIPATSRVSLTVFNLIGQEVATLTDATLAAGSYKASWNGSGATGNPASSGVYFVRIIASPIDAAPSFIQVRKMVLVR